MNKLKNCIFIALILGFTTVLYWSGLKGDYVFDDSVNILENSKLAITELSKESLKAAYGSGDAGPLGRPISMLSFALNHYFTGFDPYYFKLTNLAIHLINGILVYFLSLFILNWMNKDRESKVSINNYYALAICLVWLVLPINLTSVLYVVQRMTSLSALFGLLALVLYCKWRTEAFTYKRTIFYGLAIVLSFALSLLSKESGALFILLLYWIELTVFQAKCRNGKSLIICKLSLSQWLWVIGFLGAGALLYLIQPHLHPAAFIRREFNLEERLLTEARVVFFYLKMFIYPQLNELSLYHDDFLISHSILKPITTLYAILGLIALTLVSLVTYKKYPIVLFAWGWFVISQLMESTVFSLELVHEHRMYFGTIGFLIAGAYFVSYLNSVKLKPFIYVLIGAFILNSAFVTWQRTGIWSNLVDHAAYEATMHPQSDRANYQLARIYIKLMQNEQNEVQKIEYANQAYKYLELTKNSYLPANGAWFAEIHLDSYLGKAVSTKTVQELIERLSTQPFHNSNISFLSSFMNCQIKSFCKVDHMKAVQILVAGLDNPTSNPMLNAEIYKLLAQYYISIFNDFEKSEEFLQKAIALNNNVNGHLLLAQVYRLQGKLKQANDELIIAESFDENGVWFKEIAIEKRNIKHAVVLGK